MTRPAGPPRRSPPTGSPTGSPGCASGAQLFGDEVRTGMAEKETDLRERLGLTSMDTRARADTAPAAAATPSDPATDEEGND